MLEINAGAVLVTLASLAVAFMLWVLWNLLKQDKQFAAFAGKLLASRSVRKGEQAKLSAAGISLLRQPATSVSRQSSLFRPQSPPPVPLSREQRQSSRNPLPLHGR
jgi:hypothetical protein